jgi:Icc-related predicted phosphoesterase
MKNLSEYISEGLGRRGFSVNGIISDRLLVFDLDDTLIRSKANVVVSRGGRKILLTPEDYNTYKWQEGDIVDYSQFRSDEILDSADLTKYWRTLEREYKKGTHICILTARGDQNMVWRFFKRKGIEIKNELCIAVEDPKYGFTGSVAHKKQEAIESLVNLGYRTFVFFDDSQENLDHAKSLEKDFYDIGVKIKTVKA